MLTHNGLQTFQIGSEIQDDFTRRFTHEFFSVESHSRKTIGVGRSVKVLSISVLDILKSTLCGTDVNNKGQPHPPPAIHNTTL